MRGLFMALSLWAFARAATPVTTDWDKARIKEFCDIETCADASRKTRSSRLMQRSIDAVGRHLQAMRGQHSTTQMFGITAVFPSRVRATGGDVLHVCGIGFKNMNDVQGRGGHQVENRIHCHFRLNQTTMEALGHFMGVNADTDHQFQDHSHLISQAGIHKQGNLRTQSPGQARSFHDPLTATEAFYSKFLTTPATFKHEGELTCETPDMSKIPIGFPVVANVTISINGKEQFHQLSLANQPLAHPTVTIYDDRYTRSGYSSIHDYKSSLGRHHPDTYQPGQEEDLHIIRDKTPDTYTGSATGFSDFRPVSLGRL